MCLLLTLACWTSTNVSPKLCYLQFLIRINCTVNYWSTYHSGYKQNFCHHLMVPTNRFTNSCTINRWLIRKINSRFFGVVYSTIILGLTNNSFFFLFFFPVLVISILCLVDNTVTSLLSRHFATIIPSTFSFPIISPGLNIFFCYFG